MASRVKTRETKSGEIVAFSETAVRQNLINIEYVKTSLSCKFHIYQFTISKLNLKLSSELQLWLVVQLEY